MAFGQSYVLGKAVGWTVSGALQGLGYDEKDAQEISQVVGIGASIISAVATFDVAGGATTLMDAASDIDTESW